MRDGVRIATDLYLPVGLPGGEKVPTLLLQTRYYRAFDVRWPASAFTDRFSAMLERFGRNGYAVVAIDTRGSGASFGWIDAPWSPDEVKDGEELVRWITHQPWSNGAVGAIGTSYDGTAAEMLAANQHPAVRAVAPRFALFDCYTDIAFPGGLHLNWFTKNWGAGNDALDGGHPGTVLRFPKSVFVKGVLPVDEDRDRALLRSAIKEHEKNHDVYADMSGMTFREDRTQRGFSFADVCPFGYVRELHSAGIPMFGYTGWFDGAYPNSAIKRFNTIKNPGSRLVLGPWDHGGRQNVSEFSPSRKSAFPHGELLLRFFDLHLRNRPTGIEHEPAVWYFTMGEEKWKSSASFPPPGGKTVSVYLSEGSALRYLPPAVAAGSDTYKADYSAGTGPTSRWNSPYNPNQDQIRYPDRRREDRKLQVYDSRPLAVPLEVTGVPIVNLYVTSNAADGAFFVYLEDVWPDGSVHHVTEGELRAIHRRESEVQPLYEFPGINRTFSREDAEPIRPGETARLRFEMIATSYQFKAGHRIRVAVAGADKDHFAFVPAEPPTIEIMRNRAFPSRVELPVYGLGKPKH